MSRSWAKLLEPITLRESKGVIVAKFIRDLILFSLLLAPLYLAAYGLHYLVFHPGCRYHDAPQVEESRTPQPTTDVFS